MTDRTSQILQQIAALIEELSTLNVSTGPTPSPPSDSHSNPQVVLKKGDHVKIIRRGKHYGCTGVLTSRHGSLHWNIELDQLPKETMSLIICKADASLKILPTSA